MIVLFSTGVFAQEINWNLVNQASVNLYGNSNLEIVKEKDSRIDKLELDVTSFPQESLQVKILDMNFYPVKNIVNSDIDFVNFLFRNPKFQFLEFGFESNLNLFYDPVIVKKKLNYPININNLDTELWKYLKPSNFIDSDNLEIQKKAKQIIGNSDDLFEVVYLLSDWVNKNIDYVLEGNSEVVKKASWVLENREGVCDEYSGLLMGFLRSLGIPARYVSGIAYTNSELFNTNWELHGWVQVYFPNFGWVDFDPTYGQHGFVDVSHIPFKFSIDSGEPSTKYSMRSYGANLITNPMSYSVDVLDLFEDNSDSVNIKITPNSLNIFEGYGYLKIEIENLLDGYNVLNLNVGKLRGEEIIVELEEYEKSILLKPNEDKDVYLKYKISLGNRFNPRFEYEIPFVFSTLKNNTYETKINFASNYKSFSEEFIDNILFNFEKVENNFFDNKIDFNCSFDKEEYFIYENINLSCNYLMNDYHNLKICVDGLNLCKNLDSISDNIYFNIDNLSLAANTGLVSVSAYDSQIVKTEILPVVVNEIMNISFVELNYPKRIKFQSGFEVSFDLLSNTNKDVKGILYLFYSGQNNSWEVEFNRTKPFRIQLNSKYFLSEISDIEFVFNYEDGNGQKYSSSKELYIELYDLEFLDKVYLFLNRINKKINDLISKIA